MRLIDLLVMQGDLRLISQFDQELNLDVGGLYGRVHVLEVHFFQHIYLLVLSQHLEYLTMEGVCVGMLHYNKRKEFRGEKGSEKEPRTLLFPA